jgi:hypothetical protein
MLKVARRAAQMARRTMGARIVEESKRVELDSVEMGKR